MGKQRGGSSLCLQKEQSTLVAAVSVRKQRMISFRSGVVMAPLSKSLTYTLPDILAAAALAVKEQGGAAAGDGAVRSSAVAPGRRW